MFKIIELKLYSQKLESYKYEFSNGINYFKGTNNSGKTVFYNFIDYMFGSSERIDNKHWFSNTLSSAEMTFMFNNLTYCIKRSIKSEINYFRYADEEWGEPISLLELKDKYNSIFGFDSDALFRLREFTNENLTYRTFTLFNFLGERYLGNINDFFQKGSDIKYSTKLPVILNYIFNKNVEEIFKKKSELDILIKEVKSLKVKISKLNFINYKINYNLKKLNISINYTGKNRGAILKEIEKIKNMNETKKSNPKAKNILELESIYNNLDEQIKIYQNTINDNKSFEKENKNRLKLLKSFSSLIENRSEYKYLVAPLIDMINELDKSISFSKYLISNHTIKELKNQRDTVKKELISIESNYKPYSVDEKVRSIALVEELLVDEVDVNESELKQKEELIKSLKEEIKVLQNSNDINKIKEVSDFITYLYESCGNISDIVSIDMELRGFYIQYYKKGNHLQPKIEVENDSPEKKENYYIGSMARHTIMQLCAYLAFMKLLITENKYPLIPMLIFDHISKPFDYQNRKAIGTVFSEFYKNISIDDVQIFIFDDEDYSDLAIVPNHSESLVTDQKTGFNPFYFTKKNKQENEYSD